MAILVIGIHGCDLYMVNIIFLQLRNFNFRHKLLPEKADTVSLVLPLAGCFAEFFVIYNLL